MPCRAEDGGVTLESEVPSGLPSVEVDRERIGHVFDNLIGNALRHTPRGGHVRVSGRVDDGAVRLTVEDSGEGIAAEHLPHLFEKFYRAPRAQCRRRGSWTRDRSRGCRCPRRPVRRDQQARRGLNVPVHVADGQIRRTGMS